MVDQEGLGEESSTTDKSAIEEVSIEEIECREEAYIEICTTEF